jgi:hypothetical protein
MVFVIIFERKKEEEGIGIRELEKYSKYPLAPLYQSGELP